MRGLDTRPLRVWLACAVCVAGALCRAAFGESSQSPNASQPAWQRIASATTVEQLRAFRGDFGGIYLDAIKPACPVDPARGIRCANARGLSQGALFTPVYAIYSDAQRAAIRAAYKARGYTHFPIGIYDSRGREYHDIFPPNRNATISPYLEELWADGLYPVCFVLQDRDTADRAEAYAAGLHNRDLCRIVVPKWEMDGPDKNNTGRMNAEILATRAAFPSAELYVHFSPRRSAGGSPEDAWWHWAQQAARVRGILYQDDRWNDPGAVIDRVGDLLVRLGGIDVVLFETDIHTKFWDGRTEAQGIAYNDRILRERMTRETCGGGRCGRLAGYASGGSIPP